jgi:hypothetical protein
LLVDVGNFPEDWFSGGDRHGALFQLGQITSVHVRKFRTALPTSVIRAIAFGQKSGQGMSDPRQHRIAAVFCDQHQRLDRRAPFRRESCSRFGSLVMQLAASRGVRSLPPGWVDGSSETRYQSLVVSPGIDKSHAWYRSGSRVLIFAFVIGIIEFAQAAVLLVGDTLRRE